MILFLVKLLRERYGDEVLEIISAKYLVFQIIDNDKVKVEIEGEYNEAPDAASVESKSFKEIQKSLKEVFPDSISVPYFIDGRTDFKHYSNITENLCRVTPYLQEEDEVGHGVNERIQIDNYEQYIQFFIQLIKIQIQIDKIENT